MGRQSERPASAVSAGSLTALVALGALSALWALFLWAELLLSRLGSTPFCALGETADCTRVWDSAFASAVHRLSGLPIAGWGLVWGAVAASLPLLALWQLAERRPLEPALLSAVRLVAASGVLSVLVMLAVSAIEGALCLGCFATYVLVAGYAGIALFGWQQLGLPEAPRGLGLAVGAVVAGYMLLLFPGLQTPGPVGAEGRTAMETAARVPGSPGTGDPEIDAQLERFVESLPPRLRQTLSDSLHIYRNADPQTLPAPRRLHGSATAPVRITEWTDALCDHCADLHTTLLSLSEHVPPASFGYVSRQFPLDGACNPLLRPQEEPSVRCLAAKVRLCLEDQERIVELSGRLFEEQKRLTPELVYELAEPYGDRASLEACVTDPGTQAKLEQDVSLASHYEPDGTPIVAINGRRGTSFAPFLYAVVLTGGAADHPAFERLPPPNPNAHLH